jgi:hypothetical protein
MVPIIGAEGCCPASQGFTPDLLILKNQANKVQKNWQLITFLDVILRSPRSLWRAKLDI